MSDYLSENDPNNLANVVRDLAGRVRQLENREVAFQALDEVTSDLGDQRAGRFLALLAGVDPTDEDAIGAFISAAGELFGGELFHIGGVNLGRLMAGFSALTGEIIAAGGALRIGANAITLNGLLYAMRHLVTAGGQSMEGKLEMVTQDGLEIPAWQMSWAAQVSGTNLVANGDFATDDLTNWTKTTETNGAWTAEDANALARFTISASGPDGKLTSDAITVEAGQSYALSLAIGSNLEGYVSGPVRFTVTVQWFTVTPTLIQTDTAYYVSGVAPQSNVIASLTAPAGAVSAKVVVRFQGSGGNIGKSVTFGSIQMVESAVNHKLRFTPHLRYSDGLHDGKVQTNENKIYDPPTAPALGITGTIGH